MSILWSVLAGVVRLWAWACHRAAARWGDRATRLAGEVELLATDPTADPLSRARRDAVLARLVPLQDRAERKCDAKLAKAVRLEQVHAWLSRPRTLAGWVAGATAAPATLGVCHLCGADVPAWLRLAADAVAAAGW